MSIDFKEGDLVVITDKDAEYFYQEGDIGVIVDSRLLNIHVDFNGQGNKYITGAGKWAVSEKRMELIPVKIIGELV